MTWEGVPLGSYGFRQRTRRLDDGVGNINANSCRRVTGWTYRQHFAGGYTSSRADVVVCPKDCSDDFGVRCIAGLDLSAHG